MVVVTLGDGTLYEIDCEEIDLAKSVVEHKLRLRKDGRQLFSAIHRPLSVLDPQSKTYNSAEATDDRPLVCVRGWSYRNQS